MSYPMRNCLSQIIRAGQLKFWENNHPPPLDRGHIDQIRARVLRALFWKSISLIGKNLKFFPNVDFDSSKEASWDTEPNTKAKGFWKFQLLWRKKLNFKNALFVQKCLFLVNFGFFLEFLSIDTLQGPVFFCVIFGATFFELSKSTFEKKIWFFTCATLSIIRHLSLPSDISRCSRGCSMNSPGAVLWTASWLIQLVAFSS